MRTIAVVTVGRSDYGLYLPVLRAIGADSGLQLRLIVSGTHLVPACGATVAAIEADGFEISERVDMSLAADSPSAVSISVGLGIIGFAQALSRLRPDLLLVLGDRYEMHAAAVAAVPLRLPVAHIHGGEITEGAFDDALRHSITKLAHLHLVTTAEYGRRVRQLGEEPWRITVTGAPGIDTIRSVRATPAAELRRRWRLVDGERPLVVTFHPETLQYEETGRHIAEILAALESAGRTCIFTAPNADTSNSVIDAAIRRFVADHPESSYEQSLGAEVFFGLLRIAGAMVGNSSSGLIEAPTFELPVVNVGDRQRGRIRGPNVIDVPCERGPIADSITRALSLDFKRGLIGMLNPYGDGNAAAAIVARLKEVPLDRRLIVKRFADLPGGC
jgi:UDP-N-acetylglucosamine 2-epimerase (non-hydrolysing)/GDP/UDP-N,N'-diacetylbacillosamine 2-epimerase (hydrolysing)